MLLDDIFFGYYPPKDEEGPVQGYFLEQGNRGVLAYFRAWFSSGTQLSHLQTWHVSPQHDTDDVRNMAHLLIASGNNSSSGSNGGSGTGADNSTIGDLQNKSPKVDTSADHFFHARRTILSLRTSHQRGDTLLLLLVVGTCYI